jgi:hypothetical protein
MRLHYWWVTLSQDIESSLVKYLPWANRVLLEIPIQILLKFSRLNFLTACRRSSDSVRTFRPWGKIALFFLFSLFLQAGLESRLPKHGFFEFGWTETPLHVLHTCSIVFIVHPLEYLLTLSNWMLNRGLVREVTFHLGGIIVHLIASDNSMTRWQTRSRGSCWLSFSHSAIKRLLIVFKNRVSAWFGLFLLSVLHNYIAEDIVISFLSILIWLVR